MSGLTRVACVDDNRLLAEAIERRIRAEDWLEWAGWIAQTDTLIDDLALIHPDVVLLDIDMPGRHPLELVPDLVRANPDWRVVMFSGFVRQEYIERTIDAGAWGYISKGSSIEEVLDSIRKVAAGEFAFTSDVLAEYRRTPDT